MEVVERPQKRRQGLGRARRGHDERVAAGGDRLPALALRAGGLGERLGEPAADGGKGIGHPDEILRLSGSPSDAGAIGSACSRWPPAPTRSRNGAAPACPASCTRGGRAVTPPPA